MFRRFPLVQLAGQAGYQGCVPEEINMGYGSKVDAAAICVKSIHCIHPYQSQ